MIMIMNSKNGVTMKRIVISMLAATSLLAGCSKEEEINKIDSTIKIKAEMGFDDITRTTIVKDEDGNYLARWTEDDEQNVGLFCVDDRDICVMNASGITLINEGKKATFDFILDSSIDTDNLIFVAINSHASFGYNATTLLYNLINEQMQDWLGYYDPRADLIVSKTIHTERPTDNVNLNFTMTRLNAILELSFKNLALDNGDHVQSVTFASEQPLAGIISLSLSDLNGVTYPIPYTLIGEEKYSITLNGYKAPYYISTLPVTLKTGEEYTITVETTMATYTKSSTLPSDLELKMGDITRVTANMATATKVVK